jgi:hypothetical protein
MYGCLLHYSPHVATMQDVFLSQIKEENDYYSRAVTLIMRVSAGGSATLKLGQVDVRWSRGEVFGI